VRNVISSGFRFPFTHPPPVQARPPQPGSTAIDIQESSDIEREILSLLAKRAVEEIHPSSYGFCSRLFTIPRKTGDLRPVLNLRPLNQYIPRCHFKMESLKQVCTMINQDSPGKVICSSSEYFHSECPYHHWSSSKFYAQCSNGHDTKAYEWPPT
jgi:hypothetical protein